MIALYFVSLIIFVAYITYNIIKYGIPESISETAYLNGDKFGPPLFWLALSFTVLPLLIYWLNITEGTETQVLIFISCAGIATVGVTGRYKGISMEHKVHVASAMIGAILSLTWCCITISWMWLIAPLVVLISFVAGYLTKASRRITTDDGDIIIDHYSTHAGLFFVEVSIFVINYIAILLF